MTDSDELWGRAQRGEPLVYRPRRGRLLLIAAAAIPLVAGGLWLGARYGAWHPVTIVCTYFGVPFFTCGALWYVVKAMLGRPVLVVDAIGVVDRASAIGVGRLAWEEIAGVSLSSMGARRFVALELTQREATWARLGPVKRWLHQLNWRLYSAPVMLPDTTLPYDVERVANEVMAYREALRGEATPREP